LGLGHYVPPDHSPVIHMHQGVQGALFHIFRLPPPIVPVKQNDTKNTNIDNNSKSSDTSSFILTNKIINNDISRGQKLTSSLLSTVDARQDDIQLGFQVLRELNMIGSVILKNYDQKRVRLKYCYPDLNDDIDSTVHHHPPYDDITAESSSSSSSLVKYRVGQTIQHKVSKIRGVVIGWDIDEETKTQRIEILLDQLDFNHWIDSSLVHSIMGTKSFVRSLKRVVHVPISDVTLVTDDNMKRILNEDIKSFFNGYSSLLNRYIPNKNLAFWYSHDIDYFNSQFESHMVIRNHEGNVHKNALENVHSSLSSITSSIQNVFDRHFFSVNSMITQFNALPTQDSHQRSLISSSSLSKPILSKHFNPSSLNNPSMTSVSSRSSPLFSSSTSTSSATPSSTAVEVFTDAQINMKFITDNILDEVRSYMTGFTKAIKSINSHPPSSVTITTTKSTNTKAITTTSYKDNSTIKEFFRNVIMKNSSEGVEVLQSYINLKGKKELTQQSRYEVNEIFNAVGYLVNCFHAVDQLLQLRFQAKGMGYIDGLVVKSMYRPSSPASPSSLSPPPSSSSSVSSLSSSSPPSSRRSRRYQNSKWRLHKPSASDAASASSSSSLSIPSASLQSSSFFNHHEIHDVPSQEEIDGYCDTINEESKHPPALYQVGQVVRHKIHGYHSVIIGFEQVGAYVCLY
jgi:heat shock protein HspQ